MMLTYKSVSLQGLVTTIQLVVEIFHPVLFPLPSCQVSLLTPHLRSVLEKYKQVKVSFPRKQSFDFSPKLDSFWKIVQLKVKHKFQRVLGMAGGWMFPFF